MSELLNGYVDALALNLQKHVTEVNYPTPSASVFVGLSTAATVTSDALGFVEPAVGAYARASSVGKWASTITEVGGVPTKIVTQNSAEIEFATATASWGTVYVAAVFNSVSGPTNTDMLFGGPLTSSKTIEAQTSPVFLVNAFKLTTQNQPVTP